MTSTVVILAICVTVPLVMIGMLFADNPEERRARRDRAREELASRRRHPSALTHVRRLVDKPFDYEDGDT